MWYLLIVIQKQQNAVYIVYTRNLPHQSTQLVYDVNKLMKYS